MAKEKLPDWDHWKGMPAWKVTEFLLLLQGKDPNDPEAKKIDWKDEKEPGFKTHQKLIRARTAGEFEKFETASKRYRPFGLIEWASNPARGISVPEELQTWAKSLDTKPAGKENNSHHLGEHFAKKREECLGAAIAVIANYPEQSGFKNGKLCGAKITRLIEENAEVFWPDDGAPPLKTKQLEDLITHWIRPSEQLTKTPE